MVRLEETRKVYCVKVRLSRDLFILGTSAVSTKIAMARGCDVEEGKEENHGMRNNKRW